MVTPTGLYIKESMVDGICRIAVYTPGEQEKLRKPNRVMINLRTWAKSAAWAIRR